MMSCVLCPFVMEGQKQHQQCKRRRCVLPPNGLKLGDRRLFFGNYHLVICHIAMEHHGTSYFLIGKPSVNGPFPMAMLNNQRVKSGRWDLHSLIGSDSQN